MLLNSILKNVITKKKKQSRCTICTFYHDQKFNAKSVQKFKNTYKFLTESQCELIITRCLLIEKKI